MIDLYGTSIGDAKRLITMIDNAELGKQYRLYKSLKSRGTKDEAILSLLEREIDLRKAK